MKRMQKILSLLLTFAFILPLAACGQKATAPDNTAPDSPASNTEEKSDWPERTITVVVPFDAGGATDLIARAMQPKMEEYLGVDMAVQNMSGGSTAVGNQFLLDSDPDGYTVIEQATEIANIWSMNQSDITYRDFSYVGMAVAVPGVFVVKPDSPYQTLEDLIEDIKEKKITVGTCGGGDAWTLTYALFVDSVGGVSPEYISEGSGKNAAIAAMKGEVDVGSCGIPEVVELLQGGELRALGCLTAEDVEIEGYGKIPSIVKNCPELAEFMLYGGFIGMAVSKEVPDDITANLREAFDFAWNDAEFQEYMKTSNFVPLGYIGDEAEDYVKMRESLNASLLYDLGIAERNPADIGIEHY